MCNSLVMLISAYTQPSRTDSLSLQVCEKGNDSGVSDSTVLPFLTIPFYGDFLGLLIWRLWTLWFLDIKRASSSRYELLGHLSSLMIWHEKAKRDKHQRGKIFKCESHGGSAGHTNTIWEDVIWDGEKMILILIGFLQPLAFLCCFTLKYKEESKI